MEFLFQLICVLIIVGLLLYCAKLLPIDETIKKVITAVVVVICVLWLLQAAFGVLGGGGFGFHSYRR